MKMIFATALLALIAWPALAGSNAHDHHTSAAPAKAASVCGKDNPTGAKRSSSATSAYKRASHKMHADMNVPYTGDVDTDFVRGMIPHHQGAIDMANVVLKHGKDPEIRELATRIIAAQKQEIAAMKYWLYTRGDSGLAHDSDSEKQFEAAMHAMHKDMNIKYTGNADIDFARGMIPHHQGAIAMADILIAEGEDPMLLELSRDIIRSQAQEIAQMEEWLEAHTKH
jgi:uncharacterized protein (DUF305 family)